MIKDKIRREVERAISDPEVYVKGHDLGRLRVAFDGMCSQICHQVTGSTPHNRMMLRRRLNKFIEENPEHENVGLVQSVNAALRESENTLFRKDYVDHSESIERFISEYLTDVVRALS